MRKKNRHISHENATKKIAYCKVFLIGREEMRKSLAVSSQYCVVMIIRHIYRV